MQTITVRVSAAQLAHIRSLSDQLFNVAPGDLLLAQAFAWESGLEPAGWVDVLTAALREFVSLRKLPAGPAPTELFQHEVPARIAATEVIPGGRHE